MLTKSELKAWTDALRSGKYVQGYEFLKSVNIAGFTCYCAIGVLCDVKGYRGTKKGDMYSFDDEEFDDFLNDSYLSGKYDYGRFSYLHMPNLRDFRSVAEANDDGVPFTEIADHLDKYYPAVEGWLWQVQTMTWL